MEGYKVAYAALGSLITFNHYDGGEYKSEEYFQTSKVLWGVGLIAASLAGAASAAGIESVAVNVWVIKKNGLFGFNIVVNGLERLRFEIQQWKDKGSMVPKWKWPHFHIDLDKRHRPWQ